MSKLIIIDADITLDLEFDDVLERFQPLIKSEAEKFWSLRMEFEDKCQLAAIALWDTYERYDISKGVGFGYVAKFIIRNRFKVAIKHDKAVKRDSVDVIESLNKPLKDSIDGTTLLGDTISSGEDIAMELALRGVAKEFISLLNIDQKKTLALTMNDLNQTQISEMLGISRQAINKRIKMCRKIFVRCMNMGVV